MKKVHMLILFLFSIIFLNGCDTTTPKVENTAKNYSIKDFYPFNSNVNYIFEGIGNEYASYGIFVDYIKNDRVQIRKNNGGTESVSVIENKDGELRLVFSRGESYYREDLTSRKNDNPEILLKEPLVKGTSWTLSDGRKRFISNINVDITLPIGSFKALEVTTEDKESKTLDYYVLNKGLVKTVFSSNGNDITSSLKEEKTNSSFTQSVNFYYPNVSDSKLYYIKNTLSFNTNDSTKIAFEKLFKVAPTKKLGRLISENTKIKSLYLNDDMMVYVDFSKELTSEMNAGSGYEGMILQSITNTLGAYYGASKVYITVEGEPYSSGHILMKKGEAFTVNLKNSIELK